MFSLSLLTHFQVLIQIITGIQMVRLYFKKQRNLAICLVTVGPGLGVLLLSPTVQALVARLGWRGAMRVLAGINVITCLLGCAIGRKSVQSSKKPSLRVGTMCSFLRSIDVSFFKDATFMMLCLSIITTQLGDQLPFFHLVSQAGKQANW